MILNGRKLIEILPLRDLYSEYSEHRRLATFVYKGRECVVCGREGLLLLKTQEKRNKKGKPGAIHVDLYTTDFVLMTVDHIIPFSISKDDSLANKQPMCEPCNLSKDNKLLTIEEMRERRKNAKTVFTGVEVIRQLVGNQNVFDTDLKEIK